MIDIPAMGLSESKGTEGYLENGDIPTFKLFKQSTGDLIPLGGDIPAWTENGMYTLSSLSEMQPIPNEFVLNSAYPNPFNPVTTIRFQLPIASDVKMTVYDILGREVVVLLHEQKNAGIHTIRWNGTNRFGNSVATGTYFVVMKTLNFNQIQKVLLIK